MKRFDEGADRGQSTLLPECLDEWVEESNSVRVIDSFVDALDLADLGFAGVEPAATGRPAYHPSVLLKLYIYGRSEEHTSELQSRQYLVCRLLLEKKKKKNPTIHACRIPNAQTP